LPLACCIPLRVLTQRQLEVVGLIADGLTNQQIGAVLGLSPSTVQNHVFDALTRLGLDNRTQLAVVYDREYR
jgi:two-component system response regulator DevR